MACREHGPPHGRLLQGTGSENGVDEFVNKSTLAKKYKIPITTVWKRIQQIVKGKGHCSGGTRKPRVLSQGNCTTTFSLDTLYMYLKFSSEKQVCPSVSQYIK